MNLSIDGSSKEKQYVFLPCHEILFIEEDREKFRFIFSCFPKTLDRALFSFSIRWYVIYPNISLKKPSSKNFEKEFTIIDRSSVGPNSFEWISEKREGSVFNQIRLCLKATGATLLMWFSTYIMPVEPAKLLEEASSHPYYDTIRFLIMQKGYPLRSMHELNILDFLEKLYPKKFAYIPEAVALPAKEIIGRHPSLLVKRWMEDQPADKEKPHFLFIPFNYPSHIVLIGVDFIREMVLYYDSQGYRSSESTKNIYQNFDMHQELQQIKEFCFPGNKSASILENDRVHQGCYHSCGIYVAYCIERLSQGEPFEQICLHGNPHEEIENVRLNYALRMHEYAKNI